jgi:exopolyphosphatase/guanosine-5'-triphosphate,3'-diphosphate pyrophosphatase
MTALARWEWRAFGDDFGAADARLAALTPERVETSDELYLLSPASDASVKVRDGRLDAKRLLRVDDGGLEQWMPVLKAEFPVSETETATLLALLGVDGPARLDDVEALVTKPDLLAVRVHKHRDHYTLGGCMAERSELRTDAGAIRTIAVESPDPARVHAVVRELGLTPWPVTCVARGLKTLVGFGGRRYAVIDVGTNSVKFHVSEREADGSWRTVVDRAEVTRLGERQAPDGRLDAAAIERTTRVMTAMAAHARRLGAAQIAAVGTAGLRAAPNAAELSAAVRMEVEVLSAGDEARLAYAAATHGLELGAGSLVVFDTGGGSSQFSFARDGRLDDQFSLGVGAVRFTERFGLDGVTAPTALAAALDAIAKELAPLADRAVPEAVVGMGGAITNLAAVQQALTVYDPDAVHGTRLTRAEVERQLELYRTRPAEQRRAIVGLQSNRAEVILAGAAIVRTVLVMLGADALTVSDRGLRHGVLAERFGSATAPGRARAATSPA